MQPLMHDYEGYKGLVFTELTSFSPATQFLQFVGILREFKSSFQLFYCAVFADDELHVTCHSSYERLAFVT